jgi:hypothetical protein
MRLKLLAVLMAVSAIVCAEPVPLLHKFEMWGKHDDIATKLNLYVGWTNGFFYARGQDSLPFYDCVSNISYNQAMAMIDKYYKDHPERWSKLFTEEIVNALTVKGSPCEDKIPLRQ